MRTTIAVSLCLLLLLSCNSQSDPTPEPSDPDGTTTAPPDEAVPETTWPSGPGHSTELAGEEIEESEAGPWTVRRIARSNRGGADMRPGAPAKSLSGGSAPGGMGGRVGGRGAPVEGSAPAPDAEAFDGGAEAEMDSMERHRDENQGGSPLRAGSTDDNEDFDAFLHFLAKWSDREDTVGSYDLMDVTDRRWIRVRNREGKPVPAATVKIVDESRDAIVFEGRTYGDGSVPFYPKVALAAGTDATAAAGPDRGLLVEVAAGGERTRIRWNVDTPELVVDVDAPQPVVDPIRLDVMFLIDTTGSMGDEIERIKRSLLALTEKLRGLDREFDLHYSAVLYRDVGDAYVTKSHPFTADIVAFDQALQSIQAAGGGDTPESLNQGLAEAIGRDDWRPEAAKVVFLIADAPPHMDYQGDIRYGETVKAAVARGIKIHSVAASGLQPLGTFIFRQIAQFTRGKFIFIEYGTIQATAESHGVAGPVKSNNLDDILFTQIRDEIATWGR